MATKIKKRSKTKSRAIPAHKLDALRLVYDGARLCDSGEFISAEDTWRRAASLDPDCAPAWKFLTDFYAVSQRNTEALLCLDRLIQTSERSADSLYALGDKGSFLEQYHQARGLLHEALTLQPSPKTRLEITLLLAKIDFTEDKWESAISYASQVLEQDPKNLEALGVRQRCYFLLAWMEDDVADCRKYIGIQPDADRHSRLLFKLNYLSNVTPEAILEESLRWNELHAAPLAAQIVPHNNKPDPERLLKIGYVSPDIRNHAIMKLFPPVLERYDSENFEIFVYSIDTKRDEATEYVQSKVENFVELPLSKDEIVKRVRADEIDILVDVAGHTLHADAYLAFALKPAPLQVSWMGVLGTTGMSTMDYFIGDPYTPAPGTEHLLTEKTYRLNSPISCYRPTGAPPITPAPFFENGYITFGSFNDPRKITRDVIKIWSVILHLHPGSKLLLKYGGLDSEIGQRRIREWFRQDGITDDRLLFEGRSKPLHYLASWNKIDIALDPFPYHGGTTTMDAFWMGRPVITLAGRLPVSCGGVGLLCWMDLPVASTPEQYVALAATVAQAIPANPELHQQIRVKMIHSPIMDEVRMVRALETAYRDIWREWCAGRSSEEHAQDGRDYVGSRKTPPTGCAL